MEWCVFRPTVRSGSMFSRGLNLDKHRAGVCLYANLRYVEMMDVERMNVEPPYVELMDAELMDVEPTRRCGK